jgi:hypothetical protein
MSNTVSTVHNLEGEVGFVVEEAVFVANHHAVGPAGSGDDQEAQAFGDGSGRNLES